MAAPKSIIRLVDTFHRNIDSFKSGNYNETQVRREFIDPLFKALGWDIDNEKGYAEAYKDVIHEFSQKTKDTVKAPDYYFRIGGTGKFFVEAKKPSANIQYDIHPAFQLRRYGWSAKLQLSILTDFEEFAVYDCRIPPKKNDKASTARIKFITYDEYIERWDEIEEVFSREAVLKGSFDKFAESTKKKRGTAEVDDAFLKAMEAWRMILARNIALRNSSLSIRELNFSVQKTIDRMIFLRICEDRGIEDYGELMNLLNGENIYGRLKQIFTRADEKYNSGLFHFEVEKEREEPPDELTPNISIDDKTLKEIIKNLYYPESPYEFSVLPADILGQVYEQFLGKVIRLTPAHHAVIEDKPEVKKAGGVYYTPTYIVDYIVKNTVGKFLPVIPSEAKESQAKDRLPRRSAPRNDVLKKVSKLKIFDPACGSGSFLLGAYQYLLDWHLDYYNKHINEKGIKPGSKKSPVYEAANGEIKLTTAERKRILLNNIYGVDIDTQAVEVTKLSLLLKVLEGESEETLTNQMRMFRERALPDLANNIKCGNSLIGPDFYEQTEMSFLDEEEKLRINVFDWHSEFPQVFKPHPIPLLSKERGQGEGGFDVVIGNPPYVRQGLLNDFKKYFEINYFTNHGGADIYVYFIEKGISLINNKGIFSIIVANKWLITEYGKPLRNLLRKNKLEELIDFGDLKVFKNATTYPCILSVSKGKNKQKFKVVNVRTLNFQSIEEYVRHNKYDIDLNRLSDDGWNLSSNRELDLIDKLKSDSIMLGSLVEGKIYRGIISGLDKVFVIDKIIKDKLVNDDPKNSEIIKPFLAGKDVQRYSSLRAEKYLIFTKRGINIDEYPSIRNYLMQFKNQLEPKPKNYTGKKWEGRKKGRYRWYEIQDSIDYYKQLDKPKIVYLKFQVKPQFTIDTKGFFCNSAVWFIPEPNKKLLGILNSKLGWFLISKYCTRIQNGYQLIFKYLQNIPIAKAILNEKNIALQNISSKVDEIILLKNKLEKVKIPQEKTALQRQIDATDKQIDQLVYKLYGLTDEEIKIVEGE